MNSRMEKYDNNIATEGRTQKNKKLYDQVQNMNIDYIDINVDNAIELNTKSQKNQTRSDYQLRREVNQLIPQEMNYEKENIIEEIKNDEPKVYDINEILKLARENKLFQDNENKKRLINTEYNILTKLDINEIDKEEDYSKENLRKLIDEIYDKEKKISKKPIRHSRSEENDLFEDLSTGDFEVSEDISSKILEKDPKSISTKKEEKEVDEIENKNEDTNSEDLYVKISESDEIGKTQTQEIDFEEEFSSNKFVLISVIIIVFLLLGVGGFIFYKYFM